jgi:hypothetical protein
MSERIRYEFRLCTILPVEQGGHPVNGELRDYAFCFAKKYKRLCCLMIYIFLMRV